MARTYKRDSRGRFASGGGSGASKRPAPRPAPRGKNRLTRDNAGKITGTGDGATARGGRLRTAAGNKRAVQTARIKGGVGKLRGGKGTGLAAPQQFSAKSKRPKSASQRAKALMAAHKDGIVTYEVRSWAAKQSRQPSREARDKMRKKIAATVNKLSPEAQIKVAKSFVGKTKQQRQQQAEINTKSNQAKRARVQQAAKDAERFARASRAREKGQQFAQNASKIYGDKSQPLNRRKLANAVQKGIRQPSNKGGALSFVKTQKADPQTYERVRAERRMVNQTWRNVEAIKRRKQQSAAATAGLKQGRQAVKARNASNRLFGAKQRLPKAVTRRLPRMKNTGKGRVRQPAANAYQRLLQQQSRTRTRNISRSNRNAKPVRSSTRTVLKRPAAPAPAANP